MYYGVFRVLDSLRSTREHERGAGGYGERVGELGKAAQARELQRQRDFLLLSTYSTRFQLGTRGSGWVDAASSHRQKHFPSTSSFLCYLYLLSFTGWVLSSFFYGFLLTQIPGGFIATRFSGKHVFGLGVVLTSALTLLTPVAATTSIWLLVALRVLEGICEVR